VFWSQSIGGIDLTQQRLSIAALVLIAAPKLINQWSIKEVVSIQLGKGFPMPPRF